jgi:hypothetical protein
MSRQNKDLGRPIGQPLQVYLDNSDYSVLGDAMADPTHKHVSTLAKLIQLVDSGKIQIRFSGTSVIEASHIEKSARDAAIRRGKCIERLCGGKCFIYWPSLLAQEQANFEQERPLYSGLTNDASLWFPNLSDVAKSLGDSLEKGLLSAIKESGRSRKERRTAEKLLVKNGKLSPLGASMLKGPQRVQLLSKLAEQFPLSDRFYKEDLIVKYAAGKLSPPELVEELSIVFRDVEKFIGWTYDTRDPEQKTIRWFRDLGDRLKDIVEGMRSIVEPFAMLVPPAKFKSTIDAMTDEQLPKLRREFITKMADKLEDAQIGELGDLPALDVYVKAIGVYVKTSLKGDRKLLSSDSGDLLHLSHAPYCDVFRADGNTSQVANQVVKPYGTRVVPKLAQLVDTLEAMM